MQRTVWAGASLLMLAACGGSQDAVGENSAGSIKTTAVGEVVGNIAEPTPTPTPEATDAASNATDAVTNAADATADTAPAAADDAATTH